MTIRFKLLDDGAFVCGDTATGITSYAYPTSFHAKDAKRFPDRVAASMMANESGRADKGKDNSAFIKFDLANWELLFDCWQKREVA